MYCREKKGESDFAVALHTLNIYCIYVSNSGSDTNSFACRFSEELKYFIFSIFFSTPIGVCVCVCSRAFFFPVSFHQIKLFSFLLANLLHNWILFHRKMPTIVCTIYIKYDDTYWQHRVQLICKTEKKPTTTRAHTSCTVF